jgi:hypothetical protein
LTRKNPTDLTLFFLSYVVGSLIEAMATSIRWRGSYGFFLLHVLYFIQLYMFFQF